MMTFNKWFAGGVSAAISGGANAAAAAFIAPEVFLVPGSYEKLGLLFAGGALIGLVNYLKQSPLVEAAK